MDELNYIKCRNCGITVHYTPANTVIYYYMDYRWYSVAQTICDECEYPQAVFLLDNLDWELEWAAKNDLGFVMLEGLPSDQVADAFHELYDYPRMHGLADKEDALVKYFAYLLDSDPQERWFREDPE